MSLKMSRRQFTKSGAILGAALSPVMMSAKKSWASDRLRIAFIGCGGRGRQLMKIFMQFPDVEIVSISDVIEPYMDISMKDLISGTIEHRPDREVVHERILERSDIDAVVIATTQHWHGIPHIQACQAGKHVFTEKPLSHSIVEGRKMVTAAQKAGVVALMGTQQRAGTHYHKAVELIQSGRLGKIALVECWNYQNTGNRIGRAEDSDPPKGYHWDRWLGPAPVAPYNPTRVRGEWWFDYSGGMMTNWGVHHTDIILWAMNALSPREIVCSGDKLVVNDMSDTPDTIEASWKFDDFIMHYQYRGFNRFHKVLPRPNHHGICFHGDKATLVLDRFGYHLYDDSDTNKPTEVEPRSEQDGPWQRIFVDCIKENKKPPVDLEMSHRATVCCHLANIAYHTRSCVLWDGENEKIISPSAEAHRVDYQRRKGYQLPEV